MSTAFARENDAVLFAPPARRGAGELAVFEYLRLGSSVVPAMRLVAALSPRWIVGAPSSPTATVWTPCRGIVSYFSHDESKDGVKRRRKPRRL
jgi:hypothetical protein